MKTNLNKIKAAGACTNGYKKLLKALGKTASDDEPITISYIVDSNGAADAIWCLRTVDAFQQEKQLFAIWCARQVQHFCNHSTKIKLDELELKIAGKVLTANSLPDAAVYADSADSAYAAVAAVSAYAAAAAAVSAYAADASDAAAVYDAVYAADAADSAADAAADAADAVRKQQGIQLKLICDATEQAAESLK